MQDAAASTRASCLALQEQKPGDDKPLAGMRILMAWLAEDTLVLQNNPRETHEPAWSNCHSSYVSLLRDALRASQYITEEDMEEDLHKGIRLSMPGWIFA
jgi:hypothetical protein